MGERKRREGYMSRTSEKKTTKRIGKRGEYVSEKEVKKEERNSRKREEGEGGEYVPQN